MIEWLILKTVYGDLRLEKKPRISLFPVIILWDLQTSIITFKRAVYWVCWKVGRKVKVAPDFPQALRQLWIQLLAEPGHEALCYCTIIILYSISIAQSVTPFLSFQGSFHATTISWAPTGNIHKARMSQRQGIRIHRVPNEAFLWNKKGFI